MENLIFAGIVFIGILTSSFAGFGGALVAIPLLTIFFEPKEVIPAFALLSFFISIFLVIETYQYIKWKKVFTFLIGGLIGVPIGAYGLVHLNPDILRAVIGGLVALFGLLFLSGLRLPFKERRSTEIGVGLVSGLLGGSTSMAGPPVVIFGIGCNWDKNSFRATLLTYFLLLGIITNSSFFFFRLFTPSNLKLLLFAFVPAVFASWLGVRFKNKVSEVKFRRAILILIIAVGILGLSRILLK